MACDWGYLQPTLVALHPVRINSRGAINFLILVYLDQDRARALQIAREQTSATV
jgi:hypothetical protein